MPSGQRSTRATSATGSPARWCSTIARRCASGSWRSAATSATVLSSGAGDGSGSRLRTRWFSAVRVRRHRLIAWLVATWRTQAPGSSYPLSRVQRGQARAYASWAASSAAPRSPEMAYAQATVRPHVAS